jgi:two-component system response regulator CpxR
MHRNKTMQDILLIDDDIELTEMLAEYLNLEGFEVNCAHDGESGAQKAISETYDVIVLDVMLPKLNGFDALTRIRQQSQVPIIMLTAKGDGVDRIVGLEMGADDYLPKPCNPRELVARIRAILRRTSKKLESPLIDQKQNRLKTNDIEIRLATRDVFLQGKLLELTSSEYNILVILIQQPGQVVSKDDLSLLALNRKLTAYDRSIDMHLSNLRRKLGCRADGQPMIRTVRGAGYLYTGD